MLDVNSLDQGVDILLVEEGQALLVQHGERSPGGKDRVGLALGLVHVGDQAQVALLELALLGDL